MKKMYDMWVWFSLSNPFPAKLIYLNFHPLEVVSRYRDPQLQVAENYYDLHSKNWKLYFAMENVEDPLFICVHYGEIRLL